MSTCLHTAPGHFYYYTTKQRNYYHYSKPTAPFITRSTPSYYIQQSSSPPTLDEQIQESSIAMIKSEERMFGPRSQSPVICIPRIGMHNDNKLQKHRSAKERLVVVIGAVPCVGNSSWNWESRATRHVHDPLETVTRRELLDELLNIRNIDLDHANHAISASSSTDMSQCSTTDDAELSSMASITNDEPSIPIWADPKRIHTHRSCYEYVQAYMKKHSIPSTSPMPLPNTITFSFSSNTKQATTTTSSIHSANTYIASIMPLFSCDTVWQFASRWRRVKEMYGWPSRLKLNENLFCFVHNVAPMWEDVRNRHGGRMTITLSKEIDTLFEWILMSMIGGNLEDNNVVGVVLSKRVHGDRIEIWFQGCENSFVQETQVMRTKTRLSAQLPSSNFQNAVMAARYKKHFSNTNNRHTRFVNK